MTGPARRLGLAAAALAALAAPAVLAAEAAPPPASCAEPAEARAPDPRCGEELDGRPPEEPAPDGAGAARAILWMPRMLSRAVFWPLVEGSAFIEDHHVGDWATAVLTSDDGKIGVRPLLTYATSFLPTVGAHGFYRRLPGSTAGSSLDAAVRTAGPSVILTELAFSTPRTLGLTGNVGWNRRHDRLFSGIGPNSANDLEAMGRGNSRFASDAARAELRWSRPLPRRFGLSLHTDGQHRNYSAENVRGGSSIAEVYGSGDPACAGSTSNACVDPMQVPGFQNGLRIIHGGAALAWDLRNHDRDGSGFAASLDATYGHGVAGDPSNHATFTGEVVGAIGGLDRQLVLRGSAATVRALGDAPVPFEELIVPSGYAGMRGFPDGRFRGGSAVVGTAEYRWYIAARMDATLFTDVGTVSQGQGFSDFRADRWFPDVGVGLRVYRLPGPHWQGQISGGVELAYAPESGPRVLLAVAPF
jgi:hypothetical protein